MENEEEFGEKCEWDENSWFYTNRKNFYFFLEEDNNTKKDIKDEDNVEIQSCLNLDNSKRLEPRYEVFRNGLIIIDEGLHSYR